MAVIWKKRVIIFLIFLENQMRRSRRIYCPEQENEAEILSDVLPGQ